MSVAITPKPWEQIFDDIAGGSRAESRRRRGMPDDELNERHPPALVHGGDAELSSPRADEIVEAELVEPEPDRTDLPPRSRAARANYADRRTYPRRDFERSGSDRVASP